MAICYRFSQEKTHETENAAGASNIPAGPSLSWIQRHLFGKFHASVASPALSNCTRVRLTGHPERAQIFVLSGKPEANELFASFRLACIIDI